MKRTIRLTEGALRRIIRESIKKAINEYDERLDDPNIDDNFGNADHKPRTKKTQNKYSWEAFDDYRGAQDDPCKIEDLHKEYLNFANDQRFGYDPSWSSVR